MMASMVTLLCYLYAPKMCVPSIIKQPPCFILFIFMLVQVVVQFLRGKMLYKKRNKSLPCINFANNYTSNHKLNMFELYQEDIVVFNIWLLFPPNLWLNTWGSLRFFKLLLQRALHLTALILIKAGSLKRLKEPIDNQLVFSLDNVFKQLCQRIIWWWRNIKDEKYICTYIIIQIYMYKMWTVQTVHLIFTIKNIFNCVKTKTLANDLFLGSFIWSNQSNN